MLGDGLQMVLCGLEVFHYTKRKTKKRNDTAKATTHTKTTARRVTPPKQKVGNARGHTQHHRKEQMQVRGRTVL